MIQKGETPLATTISNLDFQYARKCSDQLQKLSNTLHSWDQSYTTWTELVCRLDAMVREAHTFLANFTEAASVKPPVGTNRQATPNGTGISPAFTGKF